MIAGNGISERLPLITDGGDTIAKSDAERFVAEAK